MQSRTEIHRRPNRPSAIAHCLSAIPARKLPHWLPLCLFLAASLSLQLHAASDDAAYVPAQPPRTMVLPTRADDFRKYCTTGPGAHAFSRIKADFDQTYLNWQCPPEPKTYGDPDPKKRSSDKADKWRHAQDVGGRVAGVAEAATLIWLVTGEQRYLDKAKEILLCACTWHFTPDWKKGPVAGATDIQYNDEAHFRLWRKLPQVYDQLRAQLTPAEKATVLAHFRERGNRSVAWIRRAKVQDIRRNSLDVDAESHPVRFMAMTGISGLALWDDLPEARDWWRFAYVFFRDQFSPWGGDDGGWAEGNSYWRGTFEHAAFQDVLIAIGDPLAYSSPFWKNSPYFALYNVQPYLHTIFGDTSNAGRFNLDPAVADYMEHVARVQQNGYFRSYAQLCNDQRVRPADKGLAGLDRTYPNASEFLVRDFVVSHLPLPPAKPLSELPPYRFFRDIGWVSLHSALGRPEDDIQVTFKSSPYGSFSHSHADQNAFILNAFGEGLAINSAYREFHRSPHHKEWTWQTKSKNDILIDGLGQKPQDKKATGTITRFETNAHQALVTGDATVAYQTGQAEKGRVRRVTRDLMFVDQRYVVLRDRVELNTPGKLSWLLHAEKGLTWDNADNTATIRGNKASLFTRLVSPGISWKGSVTDQFPVPVDPKYASGETGSSYVTGKWSNQNHLAAESAEAANSFTVFAVLWPERGTNKTITLKASVDADGVLTVSRPDGKVDRLTITDSVATPAPAAKTVKGERTPLSLPGAETHIYRNSGSEPMRLHVFKPKGWKASDHRPALVFYFGGGWTTGTPEKSETWAKWAAGLGLVGVAPDYRTNKRFGTSPLESVADARAALRWVEDHAAELGIDPAKIVVGGSSAGGHVALWTAITHAPPGSDPKESPTTKPCAIFLLSAVSDTSAVTGYTPKRFGVNTTPLSPVHQLDPQMPPMLVFHGDADTTVPQRQSLALRDRLLATDNVCEFINVPGGEHSFISQLPEWKEKARSAVSDFLVKQKLLPASAAAAAAK